MKEVFDYISNNSFLTTMFGVLVGGFFSTFTALYISNKERRERLAKEEREKYNNRAELRILKNNSKKAKPDLEVFISPYSIKFKEKEMDYDAVFPQDILDKSKHKYVDFKLQNIGNAGINYIHVCASNQITTMLVKYDELETWVKSRFAFYNALYQQKILNGETIILRVYYLEGYKIYNALSCTLSLLYEDSYKNLFEQSFFYEQNVLEPPRKISYKEYHENINVDSITDYFQEQWFLWNEKNKK